MCLQKNKVKVVIAVLLMLVFWLWFFNKAPLLDYHRQLKNMYAEVAANVSSLSLDKVKSDRSLITDAKLVDDEACHGRLPRHGAQYLFPEQQVSLKQKSRLFVNNAHAYPIWITLYTAESLDPVSSFYISPGKQSKLQLPVGEYEIDVESGSVWCNQTEGFEDSALLEPDMLMNIVPNEVTYISISSFGSMPSDMMLSSGESTAIGSNASQQVQGSGSLVLQNVVGGHYAVEGSINEKPVFFLVDTGATDVSIPYNFAMHVGVEGCENMKVTTASGVSEACRGLAKEVVVGQFIFRNVKVVYKKNMPQGTFLLGMSILRQFKMVQKEGVMVLSRK